MRADASDVRIGINAGVLHAVLARLIHPRHFSQAAIVATVKVGDRADAAKIQVGNRNLGGTCIRRGSVGGAVVGVPP